VGNENLDFRPPLKVERERRALGKSILEKKKWLKEQLSGLFITKYKQKNVHLSQG